MISLWDCVDFCTGNGFGDALPVQSSVPVPPTAEYVVAWGVGRSKECLFPSHVGAFVRETNKRLIVAIAPEYVPYYWVFTTASIPSDHRRGTDYESTYPQDSVDTRRFG